MLLNVLFPEFLSRGVLLVSCSGYIITEEFSLEQINKIV